MNYEKEAAFANRPYADQPLKQQSETSKVAGEFCSLVQTFNQPQQNEIIIELLRLVRLTRNEQINQLNSQASILQESSDILSKELSNFIK